MPTTKKLFLLIIMASFVAVSLLAIGALMPAIAGPPAIEDGPVVSDGITTQTKTPLESPRLIVELDSPPLAAAYSQSQVQAAGVNGQLDVNASAAQAYVTQLQAEQAAFVSQMQTVLAEASVSTYINELGVAEEATYQIVLNGLAVDVGSTDREVARQRLERVEGVKAVYLDQPYVTQLYTSTALINAPVVWNSSEVGGVENAGAGIKFASMDGGVHKDAAMMDGTGYEYPDGYGPNGLGLTANNNGKIIASRVYFRPWDPPAAGDENPWPGVNGTSHGIHTASTAAGGCVENVDYLGFNVGTMCGVAPKAYVMSYRVFYASVNGNESFYTAEGIAALEDIVADGADVVQNSWGEGPITEGGEFDPIDTALINAVKAGVFVSMSAGNSGPGKGTGDHPSDDYINVAASTTAGTLASGRLGVKDEPSLQDISFASSSFGSVLESGEIFEYEYLPAGVAVPANVEGCAPWPAGTFAGKAALISRGTCEFGVKVLNAEQAGAVFAIVYNNALGGEELVSMAPGAVGDQVTISSLFVGNTDGSAMVDHYTTSGASSAVLEINTQAFQAGSTPDQIIGFSSRGPGIGGTLKPDITAPGVNILAQGYAPGADGEARHLGYGQASGTSMAGPHVAGAAVLLKQLYPDWSMDTMKSALMSTAKYMEIYTTDGTPAQPLDMGAGRLDIAAAVDPGIKLSPPSLSLSTVASGTQKSMTVELFNHARVEETYVLSTLAYTDSFTNTFAMPGITLSADSITLGPRERESFTVTFDSSTSTGIGDNQGFIVMTGSVHNAHMPVWARVVPETTLADVLILDNDFSSLAPIAGTFAYDYLAYYTNALDELGYSYEVVDIDANFGSPTTIPDAAVLAGYKAILHLTGDNYRSDGTFSISTGITNLDKDRLVEYLNGGGTIIAMGQDLSSVVGAATPDAAVGSRDFYYVYRLGANYLQDSVTASGAAGEFPIEEVILPADEAPQAFTSMVVDLTQPRRYSAFGDLSGESEVPAVDTLTTGGFAIHHDVDHNRTLFDVTVVPSETIPITVTGAHIHVGAVGENGPVVRSLDLDGQFPLFVTNTLSLSGVLSPSLSMDEIGQMLSGNSYINIHTTENPSGEIRGQIEPVAVVNQPYVDELDNEFHDGSQDPNGDGTTSESNLGSTPILAYTGPYNLQDGFVALAHRDQPSLERPGTDYSGRSVYAAFGLEGMSEDFNPTVGITPTSRTELLDHFLTWAWSEPSTVIISDTSGSDAAQFKSFTASLTEGEVVKVRWDFDAGGDYVISGSDTAGYQFTNCGIYNVRAEVTDELGNVAIGEHEVVVESDCQVAIQVNLSQASTEQVVPGSVISILVEYENVGQSAVSTSIEMIVPSGTTFNAAASSASVTGLSNAWSCPDASPAGTACALDIHELGVQTSGQAVFAVQVDSQLPSEATALGFSASIPGEADIDPLSVQLASPTLLDQQNEPVLDQKLYLPLVE